MIEALLLFSYVCMFVIMSMFILIIQIISFFPQRDMWGSC